MILSIITTFQVNGIQLHGSNHFEVMKNLSQLPSQDAVIRLIVARPSQLPLPANVFMPRGEPPQAMQSSAFEKYAPERLVKVSIRFDILTYLLAVIIVNRVTYTFYGVSQIILKLEIASNIFRVRITSTYRENEV